MARIRVTKEFGFEMAHALLGYDGACRFIHGHSYTLTVTVSGEPETDPASPKLGMVIDFGELKEIVNSIIVRKYDHALVLNRATPHEQFAGSAELFDKMILVDFQPTSENLVLEFASRLLQAFPARVKLQSIRLRETATSWAEWIASDEDR